MGVVGTRGALLRLFGVTRLCGRYRDFCWFRLQALEKNRRTVPGRQPRATPEAARVICVLYYYELCLWAPSRRAAVAAALGGLDDASLVLHDTTPPFARSTAPGHAGALQGAAPSLFASQRDDDDDGQRDHVVSSSFEIAPSGLLRARLQPTTSHSTRAGKTRASAHSMAT